MNEQFITSFNAHVRFLYEGNYLTNKAYAYVIKKIGNKKSGFLIWQTLLYEKNKFSVIKNRKAQDEMVYKFLNLALEIMHSLIVRFGEPEFNDILENFKGNENAGSKTLKNIS